MTQAGDFISRFLDWWLGELGALVPGPLRRAIAGRGDALSFELSGGELVVARAAAGGVVEIGRVDLNVPIADQRTAVRKIMKKNASGRTEIVLALGGEQVLNKVLDLPSTAESELRDLLYFELDRQTPYRPEQARYDFRIADINPVTRRMQVEMVVAPVEAVDRIVALAAEWGVQPSVVTVTGIDDIANPAFDLSGGAREGTNRLGRIAASALALLAAGLLAVAVWLPLEAQRLAALDAERILAEARNSAVVAADLRDELDRVASAGSFLVRRKGETQMVTAVLANLTRLLPDDTWLFELHVRDREVRARGYAPSASAVLEMIENSPAFGNPSFSSPVTRVKGVDAERFDLTFEVADAGGRGT